MTELRNQSGLSTREASFQLNLPIDELVAQENGAPIPLFLLAQMTRLYRVDHAELMERIIQIQNLYSLRPFK